MTKAKETPDETTTPAVENLADLQQRVRVSKDKKNEFGGFAYRNAEGILAAVKHELDGAGTIICSDEMIEVGGSLFLRATVTLSLGGVESHAVGLALHALTQKGKDPAMITGSASSYARKYALQGLLAIDDGSADPDAATAPFEEAPKQVDEAPKQIEQQTPAQTRDFMKNAVEQQQTMPAMKELFANKGFVADYKTLPEPMQNEIRKARKDRTHDLEVQEVPNDIYGDTE